MFNKGIKKIYFLKQNIQSANAFLMFLNIFYIFLSHLFIILYSIQINKHKLMVAMWAIIVLL